MVPVREIIIETGQIVLLNYAGSVFCIHETLETKWEYNVTVPPSFIDFAKAYVYRREVKLKSEVVPVHN